MCGGLCKVQAANIRYQLIYAVVNLSILSLPGILSESLACKKCFKRRFHVFPFFIAVLFKFHSSIALNFSCLQLCQCTLTMLGAIIFRHSDLREKRSHYISARLAKTFAGMVPHDIRSAISSDIHQLVVESSSVTAQLTSIHISHLWVVCVDGIIK